jgi:hypothetical protein
MRDRQVVNVDEEAPIFIAGSKRGGTTLLRRIINAHSAITIPPPDWIYHTIYPYLYSYGDLTTYNNMAELIRDILELPYISRYWQLDKTIPDIVSLLPERSFRGVIATLFRVYVQTPYWGSKVPNNCFWLKEICHDFPKARFLLLYRDGRDVSFEMVETQASGWPYNLYTACIWWTKYMHAILESKQHLNPQQYHEVFYEELVSAPETVVNRICTFLNLDYEASMLEYHRNPPDAFLNRTIHQRSHHPITSSYIGVHRSLPLYDRQLQVTMMGDLMKRLGYPMEEPPRSIHVWEREWYLEEQRITSEHLRQYKQVFMTRVKERKGKTWNDNTRIQFLKNASGVVG